MGISCFAVLVIMAASSSWFGSPLSLNHSSRANIAFTRLASVLLSLWAVLPRSVVILACALFVADHRTRWLKSGVLLIAWSSVLPGSSHCLGSSAFFL